MNVDKINHIFDMQSLQNPIYEIHKELFNLTAKFTMNDWRTIRTKKYYDKYNYLSEDDQKKYTLLCVKYYIKNIKKFRQ